MTAPHGAQPVEEPRSEQELKIELGLTAYFDAVTVRTAETDVSSTLPIHDSLRDGQGALRIGAVAYVADIAAGLASGLAVLDLNRWVVTTDLHVLLTDSVVDGPARVAASVVRAGATTVVAAFTVHDESSGRVVGGGTGTFRPFPFEFDPSILDAPIGEVRRMAGDLAVERTNLVADLGFRLGVQSSVEVEVDGWLRNPWGMLHGGVTGCLIDVAAERAATAFVGRSLRSTGQMIRFLAPARVGPIRAKPLVLSVGEDGTVLVEVRLVDAGADDRLTALGTVTFV